MTDIPNPLRRQLLLRASMAEAVCPAVERDRIVAMFSIDRDHVLEQLAEAKAARERRNFIRSEEIIAELINQDKEARA